MLTLTNLSHIISIAFSRLINWLILLINLSKSCLAYALIFSCNEYSSSSAFLYTALISLFFVVLSKLKAIKKNFKKSIYNTYISTYVYISNVYQFYYYNYNLYIHMYECTYVPALEFKPLIILIPTVSF